LNRIRMITRFLKFIAILATPAPDKDQPAVPLRWHVVENTAGLIRSIPAI